MYCYEFYIEKASLGWSWISRCIYVAVMEVLQSIVSDFEKDLECPVCLSIPREIPIPACPVGHIVCRTCKTKVQECPTCKRKYPNGELEITNSLAASLIDKVPHRCKYQDFKCDIKKKLSEIVKHEKICPERTVTCPNLGCNQEVQLKKFHEHVTVKENPCATVLETRWYPQFRIHLFDRISQVEWSFIIQRKWWIWPN